MISLVFTIIGPVPAHRRAAVTILTDLKCRSDRVSCASLLGLHHGVLDDGWWELEVPYILLEDVGSWRASHTFLQL